MISISESFHLIVQEISNLLSLDNLWSLISVADYLCRRAFVCFQSDAYWLFNFSYTFCLLLFSLSDLWNSAFSKTQMLAEGLRLVYNIGTVAGLTLLKEGRERERVESFSPSEGWALVFVAADAELRLSDIGREGVAASTKW